MSKKSKHQKQQQRKQKLQTLMGFDQEEEWDYPATKGQPVNNNSEVLTVQRQVKQLKEIPGFITCRLEHDVTKTKATIDVKIKLSPAVWNEILAFFKWTYDTYKSESQVRLYVNATTNEWKAWAFPQKANTGMAALELPDDPKTAVQRAQFGAAWRYYGTVHHHCKASAFQSGTDRQNEQDQDGLHITVGYMDKDEYDIDCRLYIGGIKFTVDMSLFWAVGNYKEGIPKWAWNRLPDEGEMAEMQMCAPPPKDTAFPAEWKTNIITPPPPPVVTTIPAPFGRTTVHSSTVPYRAKLLLRSQSPRDWDFEKCHEHIRVFNMSLPEGDRLTPKQVKDRMFAIERVLDDHDLELLDICFKSDVLPGKLANWYQDKKDEPEPTPPTKTESKPSGNGHGLEFEYDEKGRCMDCQGTVGHHHVYCPRVQEWIGG